MTGLGEMGGPMSEISPSRAPIDAWQANHVRLTFFATPDALPLRPNGWWEALVGAPPERIEDMPKLGRHLEEGPFLDGSLTLSIEMNRINWVLNSPITIDPEGGVKGVPSAGSFPAVRDAFLGQVLRWMPSAPSCHRLAFGAGLFLPVRSREEGYRSLAAYLPFAPDPETSFELKYQINRPRRSRLQPELKINRLQTWAVIFLRTSLTTQDEQGRISTPEIFLDEKWSIALDLDVNTDAGLLDQLPVERVVPLAGELADLATELAIEGDRP
jgi:hypothetical protein